MSLRTQYEFLFVGRDEGSFVENYAYDLGEGGENSGKIFINLEIQNNPVDAEAIGEVIFDSIRKTFFADLEKDPYERFEEAIRTANKALIALKEEKVSKFIGNLHVLIAAIVGDTLYITQTGEAEAYLIRRRLCSPISENLSEDGVEDIFTNIASGTIEPGDFVLFASTRLVRYVSKTDLAKLCSGANLISSLGELKDDLMTEVLGKVGIIGISVHETAPKLNEREKGEIIEHLEKEEVYSDQEVASERTQRSNAGLKDAVTRLTGVVSDLKSKVSEMTSPSRRQRATRASSGNGGWSDIRSWSKDRMLTVIIVVVLLLVIGVWWMKGQAEEQQRIEEYANVLNEVTEEIGSAETTGQYNKDQAGEMLNHAEERALEVLNSGYHRAKANELLQQISDARDTLDNIVHAEPRVLGDLSTKRENVSALGLLSLNNTLYAYEYNALYPIILDEVQDPITIDDNETVVDATVYDDEDSLIFYTKSGKLIEYKDNRVTFLDSDDGQFKKGVDVDAYSNKFYVLDPDENQIWRYTRRRDSFGSAEAWNVNADIQNGVNMAIDGNIYVLNSDGYITKVYSGNREDFPVKRQPIQEMEAPTKIYTELDMNQIYILEPVNRRVLVYNKDDRTGGATYANQIVFDDVQELRDLYVDKDTNKLYVLDQTKVYEVSL